MKYDLSYEAIDRLCSEIKTFCEKKKVDKREKIKLSLLIEEMLLRYRDSFGEQTEVTLNVNSRFSFARFQLIVDCPSMNPLEADSGDFLMNSLVVQNQGQKTWKFNGKNVLLFTIPIPQTISNLYKIISAIVIGALLGVASKLFLSPSVYNTISNDFLKPITDAYTGLLCVSAILMIFFSLPLSIVQSGSMTDFQKSTKKLFTFFLTIPVVCIVILMPICLSSVQFTGSDWTPVGTLKAILDVVVSFFPSNLIAPFANFDCAQTLVIGAIFGFAFLAMGEKSRPVVSAFDKINLVAVLANNFFAKFVFIYVGLTAYAFASAKNIVFYPKFFLPVIASCAVLFLVFSFLICWKLKVSLTVLWKKLMPAFVINLSSASVGASFIDLFNEVSQDCGVDLSYTSVSLNIGTVFFKPAYAVFLFCSALFSLEFSGASVSSVWLITVLLLSIILPIAVPNIPNGASPIILLMFSHLGFDSHMSSQIAQTVISVNAILQFIIVPINIFCLQCLTVLLAAKEDRVDLEKLRKPLR